MQTETRVDLLQGYFEGNGPNSGQDYVKALKNEYSSAVENLKSEGWGIQAATPSISACMENGMLHAFWAFTIVSKKETS